MKRLTLPLELVHALEKTLRDETLTVEDKKHISEFLAINRNQGITTGDFWKLLIAVYKLYDLFKDYLE